VTASAALSLPDGSGEKRMPVETPQTVSNRYREMRKPRDPGSARFAKNAGSPAQTPQGSLSPVRKT